MQNQFGPLLRGLRSKAGKTMADVAEHLGVSVAYISDVERGNRAPLTNDRIIAVADFLGIDRSDLLKAAAADKGNFELRAKDIPPEQAVLGAELVSAWDRLSPSQVRSISKTLITRSVRSSNPLSNPYIVSTRARQRRR